MISSTYSRIRVSLFMALCALVLVQETEAFVRGSVHVNTQPILFTSRTQLAAAAKKKGAKKAEGSKKAEGTKKAAAAKQKKEKVDVEVVRKSDIIASVAGKLECTKTDAEAALSAILGSITEVRVWFFEMSEIYPMFSRLFSRVMKRMSWLARKSV